MSIIEKAVSKLERQSEPSGAREGAASKGAVVNTVQKVVAGEGASDQPTPATDVEAAAATTAIKNPAQAADGSATHAGPLLHIPFDELHARGMVSPLVPRSRVAEEFRTIKRPLLKNISGGAAAPVSNANLIMVTSAMQGDGKTFTSLCLAMSIAMEQDKTVLFVDADINRAAAGRLLGVPNNNVGLIDVLENKGIGVEDVLLSTNMPKLTIMPAGKAHERANELLASDAMHRMMLELSQRYPDRVIVFDSPPLLLTTEASVLASFMGQIVFVVAAERTPQTAVTEALEHIGEDKMVGVVLNRSRKRRSGASAYGYSYGYGYGYGSRSQDSPGSIQMETTN